MKLANIYDAKQWFQVIATEPHAQVAIMRLDPGGASSETPSAHPKSDQVLLVVEGELEVEISNGRRALRRGDVVVVPAGEVHRFRNRAGSPALTFNVYSPPAY